MDLYRLTLCEMLRGVEAGKLSAMEIVTQCMQRVDALEPHVHAWVDPEGGDQWLDAWRIEQERFARLPLRGLPLGVKDTIDVAGRTAERGTPIWKGRVAGEDAACVASLRAAGLSIAGKTVTTEFAYFAPGPTVNPFHFEHTPGGSSSGSAAAVAAQMVPVALGSQTAASVIRPASYCGVVGYVASVGAFSLRGVMPLAWSFDSLGILARFVEDVQCIRWALGAQAETSRETQRPPSVLAVDGDAFGVMDPSMREAFDSALVQIAGAGIRVERAGKFAGALELIELHQRWMSAEAARTLAFEYENFAADLGPALRSLVEEGRGIDEDGRNRLFEQRELARAELLRRWAGIEIIVAPAAPGPAPHGLASTGSPFMSRPWQLFGLPQVTLPLARDERGLPLGVQLIGRPRDDHRLLQSARWCEREFGWSFMPPGRLLARP